MPRRGAAPPSSPPPPRPGGPLPAEAGDREPLPERSGGDAVRRDPHDPDPAGGYRSGGPPGRDGTLGGRDREEALPRRGIPGPVDVPRGGRQRRRDGGGHAEADLRAVLFHEVHRAG